MYNLNLMFPNCWLWDIISISSLVFRVSWMLSCYKVCSKCILGARSCNWTDVSVNLWNKFTSLSKQMNLVWYNCYLVPQKCRTLSTVAATVKVAPHSTTPTTLSDIPLTPPGIMLLPPLVWPLPSCPSLFFPKLLMCPFSVRHAVCSGPIDT